MGMWRSGLGLALVLLAATASACSPRREPIATVGGSTPFAFPYVDPTVPNAPNVFGGGGGDASGAPSIVYPLTGAMHATNIGDITFQWNRGDANNQVFRIRLADGQAVNDFYVPCAVARCLYTLPPQGWQAVAYGHPGQQLEATIAGTDGAGGPVFTSPRVAVLFTPEPVGGGLYYWTVTATGGTTYRLPFGASRASPFIVPSSPTNPLTCSGCHSVSRNGTSISFAATSDPTSAVSFLTVASTTAPEAPTIGPDTTGGTLSGTSAHFTALNTDGSRALATTSGHVQVYDTTTGAAIDVGNTDGLLPPGKLYTHPEWSPSGRRVALTLYSSNSNATDIRPLDGEIVTLELDPVSGRATALRHIVAMSAADGLFPYYPSWSPDEHWLVFSAAPVGAYNAQTARLRLASADVDGQTCPSATCFDLMRASQGTSVASSWPKLSPFTQSNGQLLFVTFSSKIDYGFALVNSGTNGANRAQLWMAAIDLRTATTGGDPSLPPVWLPFQDITETNHLPFWTSIVACAQDGISFASCGAGQICDKGACTVVSP